MTLGIDRIPLPKVADVAKLLLLNKHDMISGPVLQIS